MLTKVEGKVRTGERMEMIYITNEGTMSQRQIKILKIADGVIQAYCYLRRANRTFKIKNILAFVPATV